MRQRSWDLPTRLILLSRPIVAPLGILQSTERLPLELLEDVLAHAPVPEIRDEMGTSVGHCHSAIQRNHSATDPFFDAGLTLILTSHKLESPWSLSAKFSNHPSYHYVSNSRVNLWHPLSSGLNKPH